MRFNLFSRNATAVDLVLFEQGGHRTVPMRGPRDGVWTVHVKGAGDGTHYGFLVDGPWDPAGGHVFNRNLLLVDPRARALSGKHAGDHLGYDPGSVGRRLMPSLGSNMARAARSVVVDRPFDWQAVGKPGHAMEDLVIYEMHVRGFTRRASVDHPGTFLGVIEKISHLVDLGVNAVELLPIMESFTEARLRELGLVNYWGYNPVALFAPDARFAAGREPGCVVDEFRTMVRELHRAGIEVILDIVLNHTAEGDHMGPTLCMKGIDNASYYRLRGDDPSRYVNWTGCGNTLDFTEPAVVDLALDCLVYWAVEMGVDGFRFDLAPVLGRDREGRFDPAAPFFERVASEPRLGGVKLIAEPWDLAAGAEVAQGRFPAGWSEWNGRFRDTLRKFMKGDGGQAALMASCLAGSPHVFMMKYHSPRASVNYVTCHDGFTLADLVSYQSKHNEANQESNRDGEDGNHSWNSGAEGPSDEAGVLGLRARRVRNLVSVLLLARGTPMLLMGDEMLRTQGGNNNAYCQDNEISWMDWSLLESTAGFHRFLKHLAAQRRAHPALRIAEPGRAVQGGPPSAPAMTWFPSLEEGPAWDGPEVRSFACRIEGRGRDDDFFLTLNAFWEPRTFLLPDPPDGRAWLLVMDTDRPAGVEIFAPGGERPLQGKGYLRVAARSVVLLRSG